MHFFTMSCINVFSIMILGICTVTTSPIVGSPTHNENINSSSETNYSEIDLLQLVAGDIEVMLRVALRTLCAANCLNVQFPLGQKVLCYVYDTYQDVSRYLSTASPDDPLYAKYSANQYIAETNLNSTCKWVQYRTNNSLPACTLMEIGKSCTMYRINELRSLIDDHLFQINQQNETEVRGRLSRFDWLQNNLQPELQESVSSVIVNALKCTTNVNGEFMC